MIFSPKEQAVGFFAGSLSLIISVSVSVSVPVPVPVPISVPVPASSLTCGLRYISSSILILYSFFNLCLQK